MRRKDKEISERVHIEEILRENKVGRLGTTVNGKPYVVPMNFVYTEDKIYLHTYKEGKKVENIIANPRVCFEVDGGEPIEGDAPCNYSWAYRSVIVDGNARILQTPEDKLNALRILCDKYAPDKGQMLSLDKMEKYKDLWVIEIIVEQMSGKKSTPLL